MSGDKQRVMIVGVKAWLHKCTNFDVRFHCSLDLNQRKNMHNFLIELDGQKTFRICLVTNNE
jgi:ABC-type nitrate/sulfonate/bicarbonate transport system ATPase subunit